MNRNESSDQEKVNIKPSFQTLDANISNKKYLKHGYASQNGEMLRTLPHFSPRKVSIFKQYVFFGNTLPEHARLNVTTILKLSDYTCTALFASSGTILAAPTVYSMFGSQLVGFFSAVGGGTIRDLFLNVQIFWFKELIYAYIAIISSTISYLAFKSACKWRYFDFCAVPRCLFFVESLGINVFSIVGVQKAKNVKMDPFVCVFCGLCTSTFGGVIRDLLVGRPVYLLNSIENKYPSSPILTSFIYMFMIETNFSAGMSLGLGVGFGLILQLCLS